ncbi:MAG: PEP-utilizing enzyme [Bacteroidales bacterium]|nr:PEP-utilizing enzyme [Bacteroidales bacterium]
MNKIITSDINTSPSLVEVGGKAFNLFLLRKLGLRIPDWVVIPSSTLEGLLKSQHREASQDNIKELNVPAEIIREIKNRFKTANNTTRFAVRSSAVAEDGKLHSFAGQFESFLHVSVNELEDKIKEVWASAYAQQVNDYYRDMKLEQKQGIAVIIQEMVDAEVSGVGFGINPVNGDVNTRVISSVYGLGSGLVSGELDADTYFLNGKLYDSKIANKSHYFSFDRNLGKITKKNCSDEQALSSSLDKKQLEEVNQHLKQLKQFFNKPQDIEFAFYQGDFYLLQSRAITAVGDNQTDNKLQSFDEEQIIWDNSNIIESYPGVTTPLTFSFITRMYENVYQQFVGLLGVSNKTIKRHQKVFENTLGLVRGRVYYNLLSWFKMLAMLPGYSINARFMETMMGVKERFDLKEKYTTGKGLAWIRIVVMVFRMLWLQFRLPAHRKTFVKHVNKVIKDFNSKDLTHITLTDLMQLYNQLESRLLVKWKPPLTNDFFFFFWFGLFKQKCEKLFPGKPSLHNDLLCGSHDIISTEPVHRALELAELVSADKNAKQLFSTQSAEEVWAELNSGAFSRVKQCFDSYIESFGERCVGELKLETYSYAQKPELLVKTIQNYVSQGIGSNKVSNNIDRRLREEAEMLVRNKLAGKRFGHMFFNFLLRQTRVHVSNRENLRFQRTRAFGMVRKIMSNMGTQMFNEGIIENKRDIFYLKLDEIREIAAYNFTESPMSLIKERKREFENYKVQPAPAERFSTYGNHFDDSSIYNSTEKLEPESALQGTGCCPGEVRAKVLVVNNPGDVQSLDGQILVTLSTDPGWVTLFPSASGIIVEKGSLLSHSAIVSREMGIPCIVGVTGLLRTLKSGDEVSMNGRTGEIQLLKTKSH